MTSSVPLDPVFVAFQQAIAGRYSLDRELGRGGMGVVYLAREVHLDRPVAIKLLPPERAAVRTLRDRFLREARLAAKLSHPNIIPIFSVEETGGFVYFVMAFVDGDTLAQRVRTRGPLSSTDGARVLREVAWALAYAHEQGLIHRDVKPDNILLEDATGRVLVADFGIAAAAGDLSDGVSGTPEFMSPEQALGTTLDARSDLYGLGATAFYAFSGRFPFEGKTATEVLAKQVTEPAPPMSTLGLTVPRKLAALVDRCLSKSPDHRPESAKALAEQLGVTLERRREMPVALRMFVKRTARFDGPGTLLATGLLTVSGAIGTALLFGGGASRVTSVTVLGATLLAALVAPAAAMVDAARDLLRQGFTHRDAASAFDVALEQAREEMALENASRRVRSERVLAALTVVGISAWVVDSVMITSGLALDVLVRTFGRLPVMMLNAMAETLLAVGVLSAIGWGKLHSKEVTPEGAFWARLWKGRLGRFAFAVASRFFKGGQVSALTHRATELSLGMAAEQLFESLPKVTRRQLGDVPATLRLLQDASQELRKRHDALNDTIAEAGEAAAGAEWADVRRMRDELYAKLAETVGALETIRLNLLRLHAGGLSVDSVTTHIGIAAEVSDEVERLIAAHGEVERTLKFPRLPATTPV